jgi:hypothetical protein
MHDAAPLVLKDFQGQIEITPDAWEVRRQALEAAKPVRQVTTADEQTVAVDALRQLKAIRTGMEATRKSVKAPVLELGKKIDATAAGFLEDVNKQEGRLQGMINHYQRKQLEHKREEDERLSNEAKHAVELETQAGELRHNAVFETDPQTRAEMLRRAEELDVQALDKKLTAEVLDVAPGIDKPKGLVVRSRITFEVIDPIVFAQAYPAFWKWHKETETLKLDRMRILDELNKESGLFRRTRFPEELSRSDDERLVNPAGLRVYEETKSHVR